MFRTFTRNDPFNSLSLRNVRNTDAGLYNCGGYATGTFSWLVFEHPVIFYLVRYGSIAATAMLIEELSETFSDRGFRLIHSINDLTGNEYAAAFRICSNGEDFHFVKRGANGRWYHKRGGAPGIYSMDTETVFSDSWDFPGISYDGPLVLFAMSKLGG